MNGGFTIKSLEQLCYSIAALEPCYGKEGGNATRIYSTGGKISEDSRSLQTVLKKITAFYDKDLTHLRRKYGKLLSCTLNAPLPLSPTLVLVPFKMRLPHFKQDGATGYINACQVKEVTSFSTTNDSGLVKCLIHLENGVSLPCCNSKANSEKRLNQANLALLHFENQHFHYPYSASMAMDKAAPDAMDRVATISRCFYELIVDHYKNQPPEDD
jgi:hypothetical protein